MLSIGGPELFLIAVVALLAVGPRELPRVLRTLNAFLRQARGLAREFQGGVDAMIREAELDEVRKQVRDVRNFNLDREIRNRIDPDGEIARGLNDDARMLTDLTSSPSKGAPRQPAPDQPEKAPEKLAEPATPPDQDDNR